MMLMFRTSMQCGATHPSSSSSDSDVVCPSASGVEGLEADSVLTGCNHASGEAGSLLNLLVISKRYTNYQMQYEIDLLIGGLQT